MKREISQEIIMKLQMLEQQANHLQQQLRAVEEGIVELQSLSLGVEELIGKTNKEIIAPIGNGIFAKAQLISEELLVDIGSKNIVKKTIPETKEIIAQQVRKLEKVKVEIQESLEEIKKEFEKIING